MRLFMIQKSMYLLISEIQIHCEYTTKKVEFTTKKVQVCKRR